MININFLDYIYSFSLLSLRNSKLFLQGIRSERDSVVVGIVGNVYNWLSFGIVGNSVCRTWESCTLAFPCAVNRVIHDSIACYAHFHKSKLRRNPNFFRKESPIIKLFSEKFGFYINLDLLGKSKLLDFSTMLLLFLPAWSCPC